MLIFRFSFFSTPRVRLHLLLYGELEFVLLFKMETSQECIICKKSDGRPIIISKCAKQTLIKSSVARNDGKVAEIQRTNRIHVHSQCRNAYTKPQLIKAVKRKIEESVSTSVLPRTEFFAIRRSKEVWSGIWTDMIIEQQLMRSIKVTGGLVHGRGLTDSIVNSWLLTMPTAVEISSELEKFTGHLFQFTEQHKDYRDSQSKCDIKD